MTDEEKKAEELAKEKARLVWDNWITDSTATVQTEYEVETNDEY